MINLKETSNPIVVQNNQKIDDIINVLGKRKHESIEQDYVFLLEAELLKEDLETLKELEDLEFYQ